MADVLKNGFNRTEDNFDTREIVTCSKRFPTAWEVAHVWPVTRMSTFMYLEEKELSKTKGEGKLKKCSCWTESEVLCRVSSWAINTSVSHGSKPLPTDVFPLDFFELTDAFSCSFKVESTSLKTSEKNSLQSDATKGYPDIPWSI